MKLAELFERAEKTTDPQFALDGRAEMVLDLSGEYQETYQVALLEDGVAVWSAGDGQWAPLRPYPHNKFYAYLLKNYPESAPELRQMMARFRSGYSKEISRLGGSGALESRHCSEELRLVLEGRSVREVLLVPIARRMKE